MRTRTIRDTVLEDVIAGLADAEGLTPEEIAQAVAELGEFSFELDSKQAEVVIAYLEDLYGHPLPAPADLDRSQFASVGALVDLIAAELSRREA